MYSGMYNFPLYGNCDFLKMPPDCVNSLDFRVKLSSDVGALSDTNCLHNYMLKIKCNVVTCFYTDTVFVYK